MPLSFPPGHRQAMPNLENPDGENIHSDGSNALVLWKILTTPLHGLPDLRRQTFAILPSRNVRYSRNARYNRTVRAPIHVQMARWG